MPVASVIPDAAGVAAEWKNVADRPVVFLTAVQYDDCLAGRTRRLAEGLARLGHEVTFVQMPSLRSAIRRWSPAATERRAPGVRVCAVPPLPLHFRLHDSALGRRWARGVAARLKSEIPGLERAVVVCSTPWWLPVIDRLGPTVLVYDCIDHVEVHSGRGRAALYAAWERELLSRATMIATVGESLREEIGAGLGSACTAPVVVIPNAVPGAWVEGPIPDPPRELLEWAGGARVVGFVGSVFEWVDQGLIRSAAERLPDHRFFVVGPRRVGVSTRALRGLDNLRLFPATPFERVPAWIAGADVCLVPFHRNRVTALADPIKVYEYLALGRPVVSSVECRVMGRAAPVTVAGDVDGFAQAVRRAVEEDTSARRASRREFARAHTWEARTHDLRHALAKALAR